MSIIISRGGKNAERLQPSVIQQEDYLQQYIYDNPESLPLHELREGLQLLILAREFPVPSGYLDALGVDADGNIYVIETKLYRNPDKRVVIAQMLDYGASLWSSYSEPGLFIEHLEREVTKIFDKGLGARLCEIYHFEPEALADYLNLLRQNVRNGAFRFVVLMDRMDDRLKELISFVNANSRFDILGVELEFYRHDDQEIIIPRLFGAETRKPSAGDSKSKIPWDTDRFFAELRAKRGAGEVEVISRLFEWTRRRGLNNWWGSGSTWGCFSPFLSHDGQEYYFFAAYTYGGIEVNFDMLSRRTAFQSEEMRLELLSRLRAVPGVAIDEKTGSRETIATRARVAKAADLLSSGSTERFLEVFDWMISIIGR